MTMRRHYQYVLLFFLWVGFYRLATRLTWMCQPHLHQPAPLLRQLLGTVLKKSFPYLSVVFSLTLYTERKLTYKPNLSFLRGRWLWLWWYSRRWCNVSQVLAWFSEGLEDYKENEWEFKWYVMHLKQKSYLKHLYRVEGSPNALLPGTLSLIWGLI